MTYYILSDLTQFVHILSDMEGQGRRMTTERLLGAQIASIRKKRGLTQAQMAESINVATETISRMECGTTMPSVKTLEKVSRALQTPLKDFFDFETSSPALSDDRENELAKLLLLLKNKEAADIRLGHRLLKTLFEQMITCQPPIRKAKKGKARGKRRGGKA